MPTNENMTLKQHMELLGITESELAFASKVPAAVIQRALAGQTISQPHAEQICNILNRSHKLVGKSGFMPEHIRGMNVYIPPDEHTQPAFNPNKR